MTPVTAPLILPQFNAAGERAGEMPAPAAFSGRPSDHTVYLAVTAQRGNARTGTQSTLTKGEVRGGGKKPYKQKHTGRARQGSIRNPHYPGGGIAFGPKPRKYTRELPQGMRRLALRSVLSGKARQGTLSVLESLSLPGHKTREAVALLRKLGLAGPVLVVTAVPDAAARRAFRNLPDARLEPASAVSVYDLLAAKSVVLLRDAVAPLELRCGKAGA